MEHCTITFEDYDLYFRNFYHNTGIKSYNLKEEYLAKLDKKLDIAEK